MALRSGKTVFPIGFKCESHKLT